MLGSTREAIAREKLAVVRPGATAVLGEPEWAPLVPEGARVVAGGAREAAEAFLGRPVDGEVEIELPGRFERARRRGLGRRAQPGRRRLARRAAAAARLRRRGVDPRATRTRGRCSSGWRRSAERSSPCSSSNPRALTPEELATLAEPLFERVRTGSDLGVALEEARREGPVLVTGSLYLLQDLAAARPPARAVR